jgi:hypothetical protein
MPGKLFAVVKLIFYIDVRTLQKKTIIIIPGVTGPQHRQAGFTAHHLRSLNKTNFYLVEKHKKC